MKKFIAKIWNGIRKLFKKVKEETKELIPIAIKIVQGVKNAVDSPMGNIIAKIITDAIPGHADNKLVAKVKGVVEAWVPKLLYELQTDNEIANIADPDKQLQAILARIKLSSKETQNVVYHGLASLILEKLSDGELSWTDSIAISEFYYREIVKKEKRN